MALIDDSAKDGVGGSIWPWCIAFYNEIEIDSIGIWHVNAMHYGQMPPTPSFVVSSIQVFELVALTQK